MAIYSSVDDFISASPWLDDKVPADPQVTTVFLGDSLTLKWSNENEPNIFDGLSILNIKIDGIMRYIIKITENVLFH